jgi:hypothetical protein
VSNPYDRRPPLSNEPESVVAETEERIRKIERGPTRFQRIVALLGVLLVVVIVATNVIARVL